MERQVIPILIFFILFNFINIKAEAQPEAEASPEANPDPAASPEAESEADPEAEAQYDAGFNPGYNPGGGFNQGNLGAGFNPSVSGDNVEIGYNPDMAGFNPGYSPGGGFNPGNLGFTPSMPGANGGGYPPIGGGGFNPGGGGFNPGGGGGGGFNPGGGGGGFNPGGGGGGGFNPGGGGGGFNPGGGGGGGFNPGGGGCNQGGECGAGFNPGYNPGGGFNPGNLGMPSPIHPGGQCPRDQCCSMESQNCCVGGQRCYNYYEQVCENVRKERCEVKYTEFCKTHTQPYCRIERITEQTSIPFERCTPTPLRKCFQYMAETCDMQREPVSVPVTWVNEKLQPGEATVHEECKEVDGCKMVQVEEQKSRQVPEKVLVGNETKVEKVCTDRWEVGPPTVVPRNQWRMEYRQACYSVPRQVCSTNQCGTDGGCGIGSVCSATDYTYRERCASPIPGEGGQGFNPGSMGGQGFNPGGMGGQGFNPGGSGGQGFNPGPQGPCNSPCGSPGGGTANPCGSCGSTSGACGGEAGCTGGGGGTVCQQVREAACFGPLGTCQAPAQTCCKITYQRVCQQVPYRVPVLVNITLPGERIRKQDCQDIERVVPVYNTVINTVFENITREKCQPERKQQCVNFTLPLYEKVNVDRNETVVLSTQKCIKQNLTRTHCETFPGAKVTCTTDSVSRRYIVNKVKCDQSRETRACRMLPWSRCVPNSGQECRMVQRTRCVPACSQTPQCNRCEQMRQSGMLESSCSSPGSTCSKFYPRDLAVDPPLSPPGGSFLGGDPSILPPRSSPPMPSHTMMGMGQVPEVGEGVVME